MQPPPLPNASPNWWQRNWKWCVPIAAVIAFIAFVGMFVAIFAFVTGIMKSTDVYQDSLARAKASLIVQAQLGSPIRAGFFAQGNIHTIYKNGDQSGSAQLSIPISGPKNKAIMDLAAKETHGVWRYSHLIVRLKNYQLIDLTNPPEIKRPASRH